MRPIKTLLIDIETSPNVAHVWGLWQQNVGINQLIEATQVIGVGWKWLGKRGTTFDSDHNPGHESMIVSIHALLDEADAVVHYNGKRFDVPHLNREFYEVGLTPPSPFKQIDLCSVVKKAFRFPSNKLAYVSQVSGLEGKLQTGGHELWIQCMAGDPKAWAKMARYCKRDVTLMEPLYHKLLPWISGHPNVSLYTDDEEPRCPRCSSEELTRQGYSYTQVGKFQQYRCKACGSWSRGGKRVSGVDVRGVA